MTDPTATVTPEQQAERLAWAVYDADAAVTLRGESLAVAARQLADRMLLLSTKVTDRPDATIDNLGEVGSYGTTVDRLCAILAERKEAARQMRYIADRTGIPWQAEYDRIIAIRQ